ncbi:uroporphyrinogen decarboxylase family protein [[Eubacterium] cellulosolvens]
MMTPRERFRATIHFRKPDLIPWLESFYDETLLHWFKQGLSADKVTVIEWAIGREGTMLANWPTVKGFDPYTYFGCQSFYGCLTPVDVGPIPRFKQRMTERTDRYIDLMTETGAVVRRLRSGDTVWYSMPMFLEFPVKDRKTWQAYKKRLNPRDPRRYAKDWEKESYIEAFESYQFGPTVMRFNGLYGFGAELMGIPAFNLMFYKDPELVHEIADYWEYFTIEVIRNAVETLKDRIDMVYWWEDMATRHGPCISPKLFQEFLFPRYRRISNFLKKNKIDRIMMDSDGYVTPILDLAVQAGITGLWPLEVNSSMDALQIRKEYGNNLFLLGNLDKRELAKGGAAMRKEVDRKIPHLIEMGGYIPSADHLIHTEFTLERFWEYSRYIKQVLGYKL